jgi:hypothetical protein
MSFFDRLDFGAIRTMKYSCIGAGSTSTFGKEVMHGVDAVIKDGIIWVNGAKVATYNTSIDIIYNKVYIADTDTLIVDLQNPQNNSGGE